MSQQEQKPLGERYKQQKARQAAQDAKKTERRSQYLQRRHELLSGWNPLSAKQREQLRATAIQHAPQQPRSATVSRL